MTLGVADAHAERYALGALSALPALLTDNLADTFFCETGPYARAGYPKHLSAFELTLQNDVVSIFGGNRTGKTTALAYMAYVWSTGLYPDWWPGRRFPMPTVGWISSVTSATVTAGLQLYLIGPEGNGGLIPRSHIIRVQMAPSTLGMAHRVTVLHEPTGLHSEIYFKTYDMGWKRFQSATINWGILDEEPPAKVYSENTTRSATTDGITVLGFTALDGVTPLVAHLLPEYGAAVPEEEEADETTKRSHVFIGWDDVPYAQISKKKRLSLAAGYLPNEREARMKGIPQMGTGLVYPVNQDIFVVDVQEALSIWAGASPPKTWPRIAALDPGGTPRGDGKTAAIICAQNPADGCLWAYAEYYERFAPIGTHVVELARRGNWIPYLIDPAGASIIDGKGVYAEYYQTMRAINPNWPIHKADKRFTLGRAALYDRMLTGGLKVVSTLRHTLAEHRSYIIKDNREFAGDHHLLDDLRYIALALQTTPDLPKIQAFEPMANIPEIRTWR